MYTRSRLARSIRFAILCSAATASSIISSAVLAQQNTDNEDSEASVEIIAITGSRVRSPGVESTSPIFSIGEEDIGYLQQPEFERVIRSLPSTIPADGGNVNNGTAGAATIDLRGLGAQRNLVLLNGRRMVPFNFNGQVDTSTIPTSLIERIDVITGGASAVYGSDAISGAVNVILKDDFNGAQLDLNHQQSGESDGDQSNIAFTVGGNFEDGRGNAVASVSWMERKPVLLGDRPLGQFGINSNTGAGLAEYRAGEDAQLPEAGCGGPNVVDINGSGSTTAMPTRFELIGAGVEGQFREDGTLGPNCSLFNFNPFNYYQTPAERYTATVMAHYTINDHAEAYTSFNFTNTSVEQQVAPSGTFGTQFTLPLYNPLIGDQALNFILDGANAAVASGVLLNGESWNDVNGNGVVDTEDTLEVRLRRRTLELGTRSERYDSQIWQMLAGFRGQLIGDWNYDISYQYGEANRTTERAGYTNVENLQNALDTRDGINCAVGGACVPIDLFGGFGTITDAAAAYSSAVALQQQKYNQEIMQVILDGPIEMISLPTATWPLSLSVGYEHRTENGSLSPDECLKLAPTSCLGGAGGNILPIDGGYKVDEFFFEGVLPIFDGYDFAETMDVEFGFRSSDYDTVGTTDSWKLGFNWRPVEPVLIRVMQQRANRAPNVGELFSPVTSGLDNATVDPCSVANAGNISDSLRALCVSTGMRAEQVGVVPDIISGQINTFAGSSPTTPPGPEQADTTTAGIVWTPTFDWANNFLLSVDYYNIEIEDIIGQFSAQEILDACYQNGNTAECAKIVRVGGDLTGDAAGVRLFTTNLKYLQAEGIEVGVNFNFDTDGLGNFEFNATINKYLTQESQSSDIVPVTDCRGFYGTTCDPISDLRWIQRTTWTYDAFTVSLLWRHINSVDVEPVEASRRFEEFRTIDSYDYFDLYAAYQMNDNLRFTLGVDNLFDKEPPVLGNDIGDTSSNSGNTFPSNYDPLGRFYKAGIQLTF
ncbi:TonB-dependent receptor domain-containing protein [Alteromonas halophila]|uniref:TonB-dependent receptor n=1 Tax=Alteromonas halophila TaxID=516698 RepID=A0A918JIX7_9ALTE|nr:TonB-dependent receptor [Alteromonas halophila]GGW79594.1 TonB-dependent receptor [Alteromonas halophila]